MGSPPRPQNHLKSTFQFMSSIYIRYFAKGYNFKLWGKVINSTKTRVMALGWVGKMSTNI